ALDDRQRAGALVWAVHEALVKAGAPDAAVAFAGLRDGAPRLRLAGGVIAAGVLELVLAGPAAIALVRLTEAGAGRVTHYSRDIEMTFREALPPLGSPTAPVFFAWMGALREEAMADSRAALARAFGEEGKGMVTNGTRLRIPQPVRFAARLRAWVWLERVLASHPSTFELGFQWAETDPKGAPRRIVAQGRQRLTWVEVGAGGHVAAAPFPDFFADFIARRQPPAGAGPFTPPLGHLPAHAGDEPLVWRRDPGANRGWGEARVALETDESHSNLVGNIYFSHAAVLAERACQKLLRALGSAPGGFFATALRLDHSGEAMPGDVLEARARLVEVRASGFETRPYCAIHLTLVNQSQGGAVIATGLARYGLFAAGGEGSAPLPLPGWLIPGQARAAL
nr:hypothetical protein [Pseudomonadota bacterium]